MKNPRETGPEEGYKSLLRRYTESDLARFVSLVIVGGVIGIGIADRNQEAGDRRVVDSLAEDAREAYNEAVRIQGCTSDIFLTDSKYRAVNENLEELEFYVDQIEDIDKERTPVYDEVINVGTTQAGLDQLSDEFVDTVIEAGRPHFIEPGLNSINPDCRSKS